jgi:hypothetical protein
MFLKLLIISIILVLAAMVFLGIRILFKRNGHFPETHAGHNKEMRKRGITCASQTNIGCSPSDVDGECMTCGKRIL